MMEFLLGTGFGVALTMLVFLLLNIWSRRRAGRQQTPPFRRRGGGPSGVREPRRPLIPAGSASAELGEDVLEPIEEARAIASELGPHKVIIETRRRRSRKTA